MEIKELDLKGVLEITLKPIRDKRGYFMRVYDNRILRTIDRDHSWVQENHSKSSSKGIIRGLHLQLPPFSEAKLVRCIKGTILDVFVDLRKGSPTYGCWGSIKLSANNYKMVLIPRGFAHGFCTLTKASEVLYKVDNYYSKENECGVMWNDSDLMIKWPNAAPIISTKDSMNMRFSDFNRIHGGI